MVTVKPVAEAWPLRPAFMPRRNSAAASEDELEVTASASSHRQRDYDESPLDARMLGLDDEAESPFLRAQKRVPVRRGALPRSTASRLKIALVLLAAASCAGFFAMILHRYAVRSWRFRLESSDQIAISGASNVSRSQVLEVMAGDIDRNIFFVSLETRRQQLEQISWVQSASVMRLLPNRLQVVITERVPVAFVEMNSRIQLIDAHGVLMEPPANPQMKYSFPVIVGMTEAEPLSTRAARMKVYMQLMRELDTDGTHYSRDLSDVDLSDPNDVKATITDPQGAVLVHLGAANFLERFKLYVAHVQEWRTHFQPLRSVDLRYERQVVLNPDGLKTAGGEGNVAEEARPEASGSENNAAAAVKPDAAPTRMAPPRKRHR